MFLFDLPFLLTGMAFPAPSPRAAAPSQPLIIFGPQYALQYETVLLLKEKFSFSGDNMDISDTNGTQFFKLKAKVFSLHNKRIIYDVNGFPVLNIKQKALTLHGTTHVYSGDGQNDTNLVCTVKKVILSLRPQAHVFFAANPSKEPDLTVEGDFHGRKFYVKNRAGLILADASRSPFTLGALLAGKDTYYVRISPFVDMALIVALINVVEEVFIDANQN